MGTKFLTVSSTKPNKNKDLCSLGSNERPEKVNLRYLSQCMSMLSKCISHNRKDGTKRKPLINILQTLKNKINYFKIQTKPSHLLYQKTSLKCKYDFQ